MKSLGKLFNLMDAKSDEDRTKVIDTLKNEDVYESHHELIETSAVNASTLVKEEVAKKILEGAEKVRCMRDVLSEVTFDMPTPSYRFTLHESVFDTLQEVPPTGAYPVAENESYREVAFSAKKYGEIAMIEEELIDDAMFDVIEMRLKDLGRKAENTFNRLAIDDVIGNATANVNYSTAEPIASISNAIKTLKGNGHTPDTLIMTATMEGDMFLDPRFRYEYSGETGNFRSRELGKKIMGLKPYLLTVTDTNGSWDGAIKGVVLDSTQTVGVGIKDNVTLEKFTEPRNDLMNLKIMMRMDVQKFFKAAVNLSS